MGLLNDPVLNDLENKRLSDLKQRYAKEKEAFSAGTGEYREIVEEEFLKEVCNFENVVVHFFHKEFFRCKVMDKHLRELSKKYRQCKFLCLDAEKAPFFIAKLAIQVLPTIITFKDGNVTDRLVGFEEVGYKDDFRTEVLER